MSGKDFLKALIQAFFIVVSLVNLAMFILGSIFESEKSFGYEVMVVPIWYGVLSMLPMAVMYSKRELTVKEVCIRKGIQLLVLEIILYVGGFGIESIKTKEPAITISFGISIMVIYVLANGIIYLLNAREAKELTDGLKHFQEEN